METKVGVVLVGLVTALPRTLERVRAALAALGLAAPAATLSRRWSCGLRRVVDLVLLRMNR